MWHLIDYAGACEDVLGHRSDHMVICRSSCWECGWAAGALLEAVLILAIFIVLPWICSLNICLIPGDVKAIIVWAPLELLKIPLLWSLWIFASWIFYLWRLVWYLVHQIDILFIRLLSSGIKSLQTILLTFLLQFDQILLELFFSFLLLLYVFFCQSVYIITWERNFHFPFDRTSILSWMAFIQLSLFTATSAGIGRVTTLI